MSRSRIEHIHSVLLDSKDKGHGSHVGVPIKQKVEAMGDMIDSSPNKFFNMADRYDVMFIRAIPDHTVPKSSVTQRSLVARFLKDPITSRACKAIFNDLYLKKKAMYRH